MTLTGQRFYVQYKPDASSLKLLLELQKTLSGSIDGRLVPPETMHLTIIHFGIYQQVLAELRRYKPTVSESVFRSELEIFLAECNRLLPATGQITTERLAWYGVRSNTLVLKCSADVILKQLHEDCLQILKHCLQSVLNENSEPFMRASPNFRYALDFRPHLTLIKSVRPIAPAPLPPAEASMLKLDRMPLQYE